MKATADSTLAWASWSPAAAYLALIASSSAAGRLCPARASSHARVASSWRTAAAGSPAMPAVRSITARAAAVSARLIRERIKIDLHLRRHRGIGDRPDPLADQRLRRLAAALVEQGVRMSQQQLLGHVRPDGGDVIEQFGGDLWRVLAGRRDRAVEGGHQRRIVPSVPVARSRWSAMRLGR